MFSYKGNQSKGNRRHRTPKPPGRCVLLPCKWEGWFIRHSLCFCRFGFQLTLLNVFFLDSDLNQVLLALVLFLNSCKFGRIKLTTLFVLSWNTILTKWNYFRYNKRYIYVKLFLQKISFQWGIKRFLWWTWCA